MSSTGSSHSDGLACPHPRGRRRSSSPSVEKPQTERQRVSGKLGTHLPPGHVGAGSHPACICAGSRGGGDGSRRREAPLPPILWLGSSGCWNIISNVEC